jgi:hypothetical protein
MPNAIKYNTSAETLALKKGNFWIGTGDVGKGPTSSTGFYNGITPPSGGYTIYLNKASGGPSIYTVNTEAQLTALTNSISVMTNLVPNGGNFADGTVNPFYWSYGGVHSVVDISNNRPYNGSQSTKALQIVNGGCWMSTDGMMTVGKTYTFSFWARKTDGTSGTVGNDKGPVWNNQNGSGELNNFSYPWYYTVLPTTTIDGTWRRYTYTFNYNAARTQLYFYGVVGTTIFTEFQITEGSAAGGPGIPTTSECLNWYSSVPTDKMIFNMDCPAIVTNGLLLNLDAGFAPSYPTVRSSWYDLSGNQKHGTLINGPTFNSNNGGSILFDGIDDYIACGNLGTFDNMSFQMFVKVLSNGGGFKAFGGAVGGGSDYDTGFNIDMQGGSSGAFTNCSIEGGFLRVGGGTDFMTSSVSFGTWCNICFTVSPTFIQFYLNGVPQNGTNRINNASSTIGMNNLVIGARVYSLPSTSINANIGSTQIYNRALTATEVLQNYNSQKDRFGL